MHNMTNIETFVLQLISIYKIYNIRKTFFANFITKICPAKENKKNISYFDGSHYIAIPHTTRPTKKRYSPPEELIKAKLKKLYFYLCRNTTFIVILYIHFALAKLQTLTLRENRFFLKLVLLCF